MRVTYTGGKLDVHMTKTERSDLRKAAAILRGLSLVDQGADELADGIIAILESLKHGPAQQEESD